MYSGCGPLLALYFGSPRAPYISMLFASCDGELAEPCSRDGKLAEPCSQDGKLAEPCSRDNIDIWGCGDGAAVVQFLSSLGVSYK